MHRVVDQISARSALPLLHIADPTGAANHARMLILETDRSIKEIAAEVGYKHVAHFSAAFRRRFGDAPSSFRKP
jgi:methylphosphotriester-DNA--protein-cysteine methyltransferase